MVLTANPLLCDDITKAKDLCDERIRVCLTSNNTMRKISKSDATANYIDTKSTKLYTK